ncbi:MAG: hypothetical protein J7485_05080 [Sphingobium sp.]|nr:hypothetical protein [Sphingobium sp.]
MFHNRLVLAALAGLLRLTSPASAQPTGSPATAARDGAHDFDFEIGVWTTSLRYLANPLSPEADRWIDYQGTSNVRSLMDGQANLVELDVAGGGGRIRGVSLRLYNPRTKQWALNFASMSNGQLTAPVYGGFDPTGRGLSTARTMSTAAPCWFASSSRPRGATRSASSSPFPPMPVPLGKTIGSRSIGDARS